MPRQIFDRTLAALGLLFLSPLLFLIAVTVLLESGSPIFFAQNRVGRQGKMFRLLKFRTMRQGQAGPSITARGDARITRAGKVLRKFKLDELPQFWNVVRGEMSLVGPRPEVPEFVDLQSPVWNLILKFRPGITDPASITYRNEELLLATAADPISFYRETVLPAKLALNLAYLKKRSVWLDLKVIGQTALCAMFPGDFQIKTEALAQKDSQ